jgi:hypothetical protein
MTGYRVLCPAALALLATVVLAACGGGSPSGPGVASIASTTAAANDAANTPAASQSDREATLLKAAQCMRANGVKDFPDPTVDSSGNVRLGGGGTGGRIFDRNDPNVRKAFQACQKYFAAARPQFTPAQQQKLQDALLKYAQCMRGNGYDMPDPQFGNGGGGPGGGLFRNINRSDPKFKTANAACQSVLAGAFPGGGRGFGGGGPGGPPPGGGTNAAPAPAGGQG